MGVRCTRPSEGWVCSKPAGHDGPCPVEPELGPWWWRIRCWLAEKTLQLGGRLEPEDRVIIHAVRPDGDYRFFYARRHR